MPFVRTIFLCCLLLFGLSAVAAPADTLGEIMERHRNGDSSAHVLLFGRFSWSTDINYKDGKKAHFETKRPDTLLKLDRFNSMSLSTQFYVAPAIRNKILSFSVGEAGSLLFILDGDTLLSTGSFCHDKDSRFARPSVREYTRFTFADSIAHLKLVYLPQPEKGIYRLGASIVPTDKANEQEQENIRDEKEITGFGFYYLALGIVFLLFYLFFRVKKELLYFALFCAFSGLYFIWDNISPGYVYEVDKFFGIFAFEFLSIFFCIVLTNKEKSKIPLAVLCLIVLIHTFPFVRNYYTLSSYTAVPMASMIIVMLLYVYIGFSILYYLVQGIGQKRWEARAILLICLIPLIIFFVLLAALGVLAGVNGQSAKSTTSLGESFGLFVTIMIYIYPLAAVLILARRNGLNQVRLMAQVTSIQRLSEENIAKEQENKRILEEQKELLEHEVAERTAEVVAQKEKIERQHKDLGVEKEKADELLRNILPEEIAEELKEKGHSDARLFDNVTVLFADFVDFTKAGEKLSPGELVDELHVCFKAFDEIISRHGIEKIKTIGDAYLAVCGLPAPDPKHATKMTLAAIEILDFMKRHKQEAGEKAFRVRIGLHTGSVVAGIVGVKKFAYDIWGDTVNTAARMEQNSEAGKINISQTTFDLVKEHFDCTYRGEIAAKNKGMLKMYFVDGSKGSA